MSSNIFTQLVIIRRILRKTKAKALNSIFIKRVLTCIEDIPIRSLAGIVISSLAVGSFQHYLDTQLSRSKINTIAKLELKSRVLSAIIQSIILNFPQLYESVTTLNGLNYNINGSDILLNDNHYARQVLAHRDLMPYLLQFLDFNSLNECCLVNMCWLLNVYSPNAIYYATTSLLSNITKQGDKLHRWQRFVNVKVIELDYEFSDDMTNNFKTGFSMLNSIEKFDSTLSCYYVGLMYLLKQIAKNCHKLKYFRFWAENQEYPEYDGLFVNFDKYPRLYLPNCKEIDLTRVLYPIIPCVNTQTLVLDGIKNIHRKFMKIMIFDADLTGIKRFYAYRIKLDFNNNSNINASSRSNKDSKDDIDKYKRILPPGKNDIIKLFGSKFTGIKYIELTDLTEDMYTLWLGMKSIMHKNDTIINIKLFEKNNAESINKMVKFIKQHKFKISELITKEPESGLYTDWQPLLTCEEYIQNSIQFLWLDFETIELVHTLFGNKNSASVDNNKVDCDNCNDINTKTKTNCTLSNSSDASSSNNNYKEKNWESETETKLIESSASSDTNGNTQDKIEFNIQFNRLVSAWITFCDTTTIFQSLKPIHNILKYQWQPKNTKNVSTKCDEEYIDDIYCVERERERNTVPTDPCDTNVEFSISMNMLDESFYDELKILFDIINDNFILKQIPLYISIVFYFGDNSTEKDEMTSREKETIFNDYIDRLEKRFDQLYIPTMCDVFDLEKQILQQSDDHDDNQGIKDKNENNKSTEEWNIKNYKAPKCNRYCRPLSRAQIKFEFVAIKNDYESSVATFEIQTAEDYAYEQDLF